MTYRAIPSVGRTHPHAPISLNQYFSHQAFEAERYFTSIVTSESLGFLPKSYCGFECKTLRRKTIRCVDSYDSRAVVSLALLAQNSILSAYANKTPIMCVNVSRLRYTLQAFEFVGKFVDPISEALDFFIVTDIQRLEDEQKTSTHPIPANAQFSRLLHSLRSSGYEQYIFALASRLSLDVDLVRCSANDSSDSAKTLFRYKRVEPMPYHGDAAKNLSADRGIGVGVLTAVNYKNRWFVRTLESSIID